jgi:hypothetical protein
MSGKNHFERGCLEGMGLDGGFHAASSNRVHNALEDSITAVSYFLFLSQQEIFLVEDAIS